MRDREDPNTGPDPAKAARPHPERPRDPSLQVVDLRVDREGRLSVELDEQLRERLERGFGEGGLSVRFPCIILNYAPCRPEDWGRRVHPDILSREPHE
jgi:hypothetical protein